MTGLPMSPAVARQTLANIEHNGRHLPDKAIRALRTVAAMKTKYVVAYEIRRKRRIPSLPDWLDDCTDPYDTRADAEASALKFRESPDTFRNVRVHTLYYLEADR